MLLYSAVLSLIYLNVSFKLLVQKWSKKVKVTTLTNIHLHCSSIFMSLVSFYGAL